MTLPMFEVADEISKDLSNYEAMWFLLEEFNTGLQELAKEDWISFRSVFSQYIPPSCVGVAHLPLPVCISDTTENCKNSVWCCC